MLRTTTTTAGRRIPGEMFMPDDAPVWAPLERLLPEDDLLLCADFMYMFAVRLEDGRRLHAYKHRWTRAYVHISDDGEPFFYDDRAPVGLDEPGLYAPIRDVARHVRAILGDYVHGPEATAEERDALGRCLARLEAGPR